MVHEKSTKKKHGSPFIVVVGESWPEPECEIHVESPPSRDRRERIVERFANLCCVLLLCLMIYAMAVQNDHLIDRVFDLVRWGFILVFGWVGGVRLVKFASRIRLDGDEE